MGVYDGEPKASHCKRPYRSDASISRDVTAAMFVYRTIAKKLFWDFDSIIVQNISDILPSFCTSTWRSHQVIENQEFSVFT